MILFLLFTVLQIAHILVGSQALGTSRNVQIWRVDPITFLLNPHNAIATLEIANTSLPYTSPMKILAYRPHFDDKINSNLAVVFINVDAVFPCTLDGHAPICHLFSGEEDNFYRGRATIQAGDLGNDFRIFSDRSNVATFGFGLEGCSTFDIDCVPNTEVELVCVLPRNQCTQRRL